ncbi:hypothetical protein L3X38_025469 [Prunus dulcis]|uniref:Uncharacterized protein n=1 Tax=Prunus dulcis TaxID=3755 RepID=A0AAD4W2J6_PRUDU|nr:hypothetical protein L3X38_025469 [Prunus dulcis]
MAMKGSSSGSARSSQSAQVEASPICRWLRARQLVWLQLLLGELRRGELMSSCPGTRGREELKNTRGGRAGGGREVVLNSYQETIKVVLKVEVVEGLFIEKMGHSGMTLATLEDQMKVKYSGTLVLPYPLMVMEVTVAELSRKIGEKAKVKEELGLVCGRLETEMKKNVELLLSMNKLTEDKHGLGVELSKAQKDLGEANRKIEAFASELRSYYDDSFLGEDAEDALAEQDEGPDAEPIGQSSAHIAQIEDPSTHGGEVTARERDQTEQGREPTIQGGELTSEVVVIISNETRGGGEA